jgi:hypothetical protein
MASGECVFAVTPGAAQVASGKPHEDARQPGKGRFALYGFVDFDEKHEKMRFKKSVSGKGVSRKSVSNTTTLTIVHIPNTANDLSCSASYEGD